MIFKELGTAMLLSGLFSSLALLALYRGSPEVWEHTKNTRIANTYTTIYNHNITNNKQIATQR